MSVNRVTRMFRKLIVPGVIGLVLPGALWADDTKTVPPGTNVTIVVKPAEAAAPLVSVRLRDRHGHVTPVRSGCAHIGGGNIDVAQPGPDTVVITMSGSAVAAGHPKGTSANLAFDLQQSLEVVFEKPEVKTAKLTMEGRVIGVLRGSKKGGASITGGVASLCGTTGSEVVSITMPEHATSCADALSINDKPTPVFGIVSAGCFNLAMAWQINAHNAGLLDHAASAEFADGAVDPLWLPAKAPFYGIGKKDFGYQVILKVVEETVDKKDEEKKDEPKPNGDKKEEKKAELKPGAPALKSDVKPVLKDLPRADLKPTLAPVPATSAPATRLQPTLAPMPVAAPLPAAPLPTVPVLPR